MDTLKKILKYIAVPVLVLVLFMAGEIYLGRLVTPVTDADYFNMDVAAIEAAGQDVDLMFLGSSRIYRSFVPEEFEKNPAFDLCLVCGSSSQKMDASYYMLKDMYSRVHPKTVVLGVQWNSFDTEGANSVKMENILKVYDRISAAGKAGYIFRSVGTDVFPELFYLYRYRSRFSNERIEENNRDKEELRTHGYTPDTSQDYYYLSKGFNYSNVNVENGNMVIETKGVNRYEPERFDSDLVKYLDRITAFCKEKGIRLILVSPPNAMMTLYYVENIQGAMDYFADYALRNGLTYHNLNLLKGRESLLKDEIYYDGWHFSGEGAYIISDLYAQILEKELAGEDISDMFYQDLEALKQEVDRVVAVSAVAEVSDDEIHISIHSLHNDDDVPLYKLEISEDGGKSYECVYDWSEDELLKIKIPAKEAVMYKISAALSEDDEYPAWQVYDIGSWLDPEKGEEIY